MAYKLNLTMDQGSDFLSSFNISHANGSAFDLSSFTAASQMRKHASANTAVDIHVGLSANGIVELYLSSTETAVVEPGRYVYDTEVTDNMGNTYRLIEGMLTVTANITR